jgi:hypothetical protein
MLNILNLTLIVLLIILGSSILFFTIFGTSLINISLSGKLDLVRKKYSTLLLTIAVLMLLGAFSIIVLPSNHAANTWSDEQKEVMIKKIMESSIFVHGIGADTVRLVSECFINKYTSSYTPSQMKEQNKMNNNDILRITSELMTECLRNYGLPVIDTTSLK